ncbi:MAG: TetR/AcrR family transcriptional regulator [Candidatus Marinimicrobia bacterium]|nr:TetR/AcrR family transcriptional regulator [Candidatus Neomarinimicrobiota bacterium]
MTNTISQQEEHILEEGFEAMTRSGVKSFTVESLAGRLGMSKKTIYKYFPTKEKLIRKIVVFITGQVEQKFSKICKTEKNPAIQFVKVMEHISKFASRAPLQRMAQLKTAYPAAWKEIETFRLNRQDDFYRILKSAQDQGLARNDVDMRKFSIVFINMINNTFQPEFFLQNDLAVGETIDGVAKIISRGIFTSKGLEAIKKYYEQNSI